MRFVTVRELRSQSAEVWAATEHEDVVITSNGRPLAVLVKVEGGDVEETLTAIRRARAQEALSRLRQQAVRNGTVNLTPDEIEAEIDAARRDRLRS